MKKSGSCASILPNIPRSPERDFIPIRSVTYKKKLEDIKDFRQIRDIHGSMPGLAPATTRNSNQDPANDPLSAMMKTHNSNFKPRIDLQLHRLDLGSKNKCQTTREYPPNPQVYTRPVLPPPPANKTLKKLMTRNLTSIKGGIIDDQEDYFKLLFDKSRKVFNVYEHEGSDEYYTNAMITSRIHKQGFRDSNYYSTPLKFDTLLVPEEQDIKRDYMLKISPWVSTMENNKTIATHVLGGTVNNYKYVEFLAQSARDMLEATKQEKDSIVEDLKTIEKKFENELESLIGEFSQRFKELDTFDKEDAISSQADNFKKQKEITLLKRDKLNLENNITKAVKKTDRLEDVLYGRNIFELQSSQENLENISENNLRKVHSGLMKNSQLIH